MNWRLSRYLNSSSLGPLNRFPETTVKYLINKARTRAVVLDFFETLVELEQDVPRSWELLVGWGFRSSAEVEAAWTAEAFNGGTTPAGIMYRKWHRSLFAGHARAAGVPDRSLETVVDELVANDRRWTVRAKRGAPELLDLLVSEGIAPVVCTNWDYPLEPYLRQAGLPEHLQSVCSWQVGARKPAGLIICAAVRLTGTEISSAMMLGDSLDCDVAGAVRLGVPALWLGGDRRHPFVQAGLAQTVADLDEAGRALCR